MQKKRILILHINPLKFEKFIANELENRGHYVEEYNIHGDIRYVYKNYKDRVKNFFTKAFLNYNIKTEYKKDFIKLKLKEKFDIIFVTRPDILTKDYLSQIDKFNINKITYLYDSINRFPKAISSVKVFNEVYSYQKEDCKNYNYKFITNFIYQEDHSKLKDLRYEMFMIFRYDFRFPILEKLGKYLSDKNLPYKFIVVDPDKIIKTEYCEYRKDFLYLNEVNKLANQSKILLDIQRDDQIGLSFRPFEALGLHKKLITTNKDIINYDFYNPNNIFVLEENNINIPDSFFNSPYKKIPEEIYNKYLLKSWVDTVFNKYL